MAYGCGSGATCVAGWARGMRAHMRVHATQESGTRARPGSRRTDPVLSRTQLTGTASMAATSSRSEPIGHAWAESGLRSEPLKNEYPCLIERTPSPLRPKLLSASQSSSSAVMSCFRGTPGTRSSPLLVRIRAVTMGWRARSARPWKTSPLRARSVDNRAQDVRAPCARRVVGRGRRLRRDASGTVRASECADGRVARLGSASSHGVAGRHRRRFPAADGWK